MSNPQSYSSLFTTIYDQPEAISNFSRGAHYSILRSVEWLNVERKNILTPEIHDFAVIWDRDHDVRVIKAIEKIYLAGFLSPIQFIGEDKGELTVILASKYVFSEDDVIAYKKQVTAIAENLGFDSWVCSFGKFDRAGVDNHCAFNDLLADSHANAFTYLRSIDLQWELGTYKPSYKIV